MIDNTVNTIKSVLDIMGIEVPVKEIAADIDDADKNSNGDEDMNISSIVDKYSKLSMHKEKGQESATENTITALIACQTILAMCIASGSCCVGAGKATVAFHGRAEKKRTGEYLFILKPDRSVIVQGMAGIIPVCYMSKAEQVKVSIKNDTLAIIARGKDEELTIELEKPYTFRDLYQPLKNIDVQEKIRKSADNQLSEDERLLETRLKELRKGLAAVNNIRYLPAIFDNRVMYQLIKIRPATIPDLKQIKGFGDLRIQKYGEQVLKTINTA